MPYHEAHNLEGAKGAYCQVYAMYIYLFIYRFVQIYGTVSDSKEFIIYIYRERRVSYSVIRVTKRIA